MTLDDVLTLDEAADVSGRAAVTLRRAASLGRLEARRIGRGGTRSVWITTRDAISDYLALMAAKEWESIPQRQRRPGGQPRRRPRTRASTTV